MEKSGEKQKTKVMNTLKRGFVSSIAPSPIIEIEGNRKVNLEGSRGVLHYSETMIRISMSGFVAVFEGRGLRLQCISPTSLILEGFFTDIHFEI